LILSSYLLSHILHFIYHILWLRVDAVIPKSIEHILVIFTVQIQEKMSTEQPRLTPNKTNENCNPEHSNFALSSHKIDKVSIDRFGGVHRDQQIIYQNYAPLVRVDVAV